MRNNCMLVIIIYLYFSRGVQNKNKGLVSDSVPGKNHAILVD